MKFDIWTFTFQVINFVVLLFILKRLLYKPIREILRKRRELVEKIIVEAEEKKNEALASKAEHLREMDRLDGLKARMIEEMNAEVVEEKKRLIGEAEKEAARRIEKGMALLEIEKAGFENELKEKAIHIVSAFSSGILRDIADEELHRSIWRRFLTELEGIAGDITAKGLKNETVMLEIATAYPLTEEELEVLRRDMGNYLSREVMISCTVDSTLLAGLKIKLHDMVFDSSLSGQVGAFTVKLKGTV
jgi:F-type H+-transporting ATPase subunit b